MTWTVQTCDCDETAAPFPGSLPMPTRPTVLAALILCALARTSIADPPPGMVDLTGAVIFEPSRKESGKAVEVLSEYILSRTHNSIKIADHWPEGNLPTIVVGLRSKSSLRLGPREARRGFRGPGRRGLRDRGRPEPASRRGGRE